MEVGNIKYTEHAYKADGPVQPLAKPHALGSAPLIQMPPSRPYPMPFPIYTPVYTIPVVAEMPYVPVVTQNTPSVQQSARDEADTQNNSALKGTTILGMQPLTASIWGLALIVSGVLVYKNRDSIKKIFS